MMTMITGMTGIGTFILHTVSTDGILRSGARDTGGHGVWAGTIRSGMTRSGDHHGAGASVHTGLIRSIMPAIGAAGTIRSSMILSSITAAQSICTAVAVGIHHVISMTGNSLPEDLNPVWQGSLAQAWDVSSVQVQALLHQPGTQLQAAAQPSCRLLQG